MSNDSHKDTRKRVLVLTSDRGDAQILEGRFRNDPDVAIKAMSLRDAYDPGMGNSFLMEQKGNFDLMVFDAHLDIRQTQRTYDAIGALRTYSSGVGFVEPPPLAVFGLSSTRIAQRIRINQVSEINGSMRSPESDPTTNLVTLLTGIKQVLGMAADQPRMIIDPPSRQVHTPEDHGGDVRDQRRERGRSSYINWL